MDQSATRLFTRRIDRAALTVYILGAIVPLVALAVVVDRYVLPEMQAGHMSVALIGAVALGPRLRANWSALGRSALVGAALLGMVFIGVNALYTHVVVAPYTKADALRNLRFMGETRIHLDDNVRDAR